MVNKPRFFSLFCASLMAGMFCFSLPTKAQTAARILAKPVGMRCQSGLRTRLILHGVGFLPHSDRLTASASAQLDEAAELVKHHPCASVYIETAVTHDADALSRTRARVIEAHLTRDGVVPAHLVVAQVQAQPPVSAPSSLIMATQQSRLIPPRS